MSLDKRIFFGCMNGVGSVMTWNVNVAFLLKTISKIYIQIRKKEMFSWRRLTKQNKITGYYNLRFDNFNNKRHSCTDV